MVSIWRKSNFWFLSHKYEGTFDFYTNTRWGARRCPGIAVKVPDVACVCQLPGLNLH